MIEHNLILLKRSIFMVNSAFRCITGLVLFLILAFCSENSAAQEGSKKLSPIPQDTVAKTNTNKTLNTEESINYIGSKLLFQVKKRFNLTTKEEEEKENKKEKKVVLSFGSLKIET